jgi:hypothetical protein
MILIMHNLEQPKANQEDQIPNWKRPEFYSSADTKKVGGLLVKCFYDEEKDQRYVSWMKENKAYNGCKPYGDSYQKVSAPELPILVAILKETFREIAGTHYMHELPRFINNPLADIIDRYDDRFWDETVAARLPSGSLVVRPFKTPEGTFVIKFLAPKKVAANSNWNGTCITIPVGICKQLNDYFCGILKEIEFKEQDKLTGRKPQAG